MPETSAYFMARGRDFYQNLLEDLPYPWNLNGMEAVNSQQPSYELLMKMTTPTNLTYKQ